MIMMKKVTLESCGQVMFQNRCHGLAPSMSAASYSSWRHAGEAGKVQQHIVRADRTPEPHQQQRRLGPVVVGQPLRRRQPVGVGCPLVCSTICGSTQNTQAMPTIAISPTIVEPSTIAESPIARSGMQLYLRPRESR